jgi:hypothetical protein
VAKVGRRYRLIGWNDNGLHDKQLNLAACADLITWPWSCRVPFSNNARSALSIRSYPFIVVIVFVRMLWMSITILPRIMFLHIKIPDPRRPCRSRSCSCL